MPEVPLTTRARTVKRHAKSLAHNSYFFFSSRRRHTRFDCDWSSDVCSSDLPALGRSHSATAAAPCARCPSKARLRTRLACRRKEQVMTTLRRSTIAAVCLSAGRSEEHTSELQSQSNLVCRLLLEKKKKTKMH